jgi:hypothetical protein
MTPHRLCHRAAAVRAAAVAALVAPALSAAQSPQQQVSPPVAQAWIDLGTATGPAGMGAMVGMAGGNPMAALGSLLGGGSGAQNVFGNTRTDPPGRWMDVTLSTRANPNLAEATMSVPAGTGLAPALKLVSPATQKAPPPERDDEEPDAGRQELRGKFSLYWGCGETVRAGQPRTVDLAKTPLQAAGAELAQILNGRRATQRGAHAAVGRPIWPNAQDARLVPAQASLVGEHGFIGSGVPEGFRFALPAAYDLMPPLAVTQADVGGATRLRWTGMPQARAYFLAAMGQKAGEDEHLVIWTSSELPDSGFGLLDYQTNAAVDRWLREKVLLAPTTTECTVPRGIFGDGAMLRAIAYGSELNLAHPPRPADPKVAWEPQWAVKVRLKSTAMAMLGDAGAAESAGPTTPAPPPEPAAAKPDDPLQKSIGVLRGILGR